MDVPGHFRISLTASEPMIERSLPVFAEVAQTSWTDRRAAE
jgi:aspartate aminotransferase